MPEPVAARVSAAPPVAPPGSNSFRWAQVESASLPVLVSNLRLYQCPGQTVFYIAEGRLKDAYASNYVVNFNPRSYASPQDQMRERIQKKILVDREIESILHDELHLSAPPRSAGVMFSAEDEQHIADAFALYPKTHSDYGNPNSVLLNATNRLNRLHYLAACFDSEKMQYYKLDREGDAVLVGNLAKNLHPTRAEFFAIGAAIEGKDTTLEDGAFKPDVARSLKAVLSPERFLLLQNLQREEIKAVFTFANFHGLSWDIADHLAGLRINLGQTDLIRYQAQVEALIKDPDLASRYLRNVSIHPNPAWPASN